METENPVTYRYMHRNFNDSAGDPGGAFSDCSSSCAGGTTTLHHRLTPSPATIYSDESLRSLISDLESPSATIDTQRHAAMELRLLAKHSPENRSQIAGAGAVVPLISLISSPDSLLQEHGVTAILNLSLLDENKDLIAAAGAIKPLVRALRSPSLAARENAACALFRLSHSDVLKATIARSGAIPPLISLLESGRLRAKKDAITALYALCSISENKIRAVEAGIMKPLLEMMAETDGELVDKAGCVLRKVTGEEKGRVAAVSDGGIPVLVEVIEVGTQRQKEIAAAALLQICEGSPAHSALAVREGAIPPLVSLSQSGNSRAMKKAEMLIEMLRQRRTMEDC
ncbi:Armadillo-like helical-containing protein [Dioscorea alata]|uniref:Armadillo-like helical-containing protein n=1 Tax=Dioscorea alata TaxID=55571 RepID=A0ACB7U0U8_DIOAL|nr:Armadillo-like helical-containing protein [Dioscorea alata]